MAAVALVACTAVQGLATLPSCHGALLVCVLAALALLWTRCVAVRLGMVAVLFAAWTLFHAALAMQARWPASLDGKDVTVTGRVVGLPRRTGADVSFVLAPESQRGEAHAPQGRLRLTWYRSGAAPAPCERWRLTVRLRRPRAVLNPGPADGERTSLQRRVAATGYVRTAPGNRRLSEATCADGWRARIATALDIALGERRARILKALAVGDTRGLDAADWDTARATGVSHLMAISGFHVGVAGAGGTLLGRLLYVLLPGLALRIPRPIAEASAGLAVAGVYAVLAGLGLPTVRSLLMIAVVVAAACFRRRTSGVTLLAVASLVLLGFDPLSVLSGGFWLSFAGVGFLMLCVGPASAGWRGWLGGLLRAQAAMSIALLPLCLWFFGSASLVGFAANLLAAPLVSFVVVPLTLIGCALLGAPALAVIFLTPACWLLSHLWRLLEAMAQMPMAAIGVAEGIVAATVLATAGAAWMFAPRGVPLRGCGALLLLPMFLPPREPPQHGAFRMWALDVGQGLAVLVRTRSHTLVYDAGPAYAGGRDAGAGVVLPAIAGLGIGPVDRLVISHGDSDHAGGAATVAARYPDAARLSGEPGRLSFPSEPCTGQGPWTWDGVLFHFLDVPGARGGKAASNDRSCVLAIEGAGGRLVLTGDIGHGAERRMAAADLASPLPTVTTVAHHGSRHSSELPWLTAVKPTISIASAGWRNRFGHPHPSVVDRHAAMGSDVYVTARSGAVRVDFPVAAPPVVVREWRRPAMRYWRE